MKRVLISARIDFLAIAAKLYPQLIGDLADEPYQLFCSDARAAEKCKAVLRWQRQWRLSNAWITEIAADTMRHWRFFGGKVGREWCAFGTPVAAFCPRFVSAQWYPDTSADDFRRKTIAALDAWIDKIEQSNRAVVVDEAGEEAAAEQCDDLPPAPKAREHFTWLAKYQVGRESIGDIWRELEGDQRGRRAVELAIRRAAQGIGLALR